MDTSSTSVVTTTRVGFSGNNFNSFTNTLSKFPTKLNGLSLIYFIKDLGKINLSLDDEVEMIISGEYEKDKKK